MPLSDSDADKLCRGRIVYIRNPPASSGTYRTHPHYAIILDSAERILATRRSRVVFITTNDQLDPNYLIPVPPQTGLNGNVACSWYPVLEESQFDELWNGNQPPLTDADLVPIEEMILRHHREAGRANRG